MDGQCQSTSAPDEEYTHGMRDLDLCISRATATLSFRITATVLQAMLAVHPQIEFGKALLLGSGCSYGVLALALVGRPFSQ